MVIIRISAESKNPDKNFGIKMIDISEIPKNTLLTIMEVDANQKILDTIINSMHIGYTLGVSSFED